MRLTTKNLISKVSIPRVANNIGVIVEVERAMEEIVDKENNMKQLVQVTNSLYERTTDLQKQFDQQAEELEDAKLMNQTLQENQQQ